MSEDFVPEVNNTPDVEETKSPLKTVVENVSELAAKAGDLVGDAVSEVAAGVKETLKETVEAVKDAVSKDDDKVEEVVEEEEEKDEMVEETVDLGSLTLAELSDMFDKLSQDENRMKRYKEAEAIKSAFYKRLSKEKAEAGLGSKVDEPSSREDVIEDVTPAPQSEEVKEDNPFEAMETAFKGVYANYKRERAEFNRQQDAQREDNFVAKQAVIDDLKALVEKQEDVSSRTVGGRSVPFPPPSSVT